MTEWFCDKLSGFFVRFDHNAWQEDGNIILLCLFVTDSLADGMTDFITDWMIDWMSNLQYQDTD